MGKKKQRLKKPTKSDSKRVREPNLFESLYNRKKFDILGKKVKDTQRKRGRARSEGIHKVGLSLFTQSDCQTVFQEPCTEILCNCAAQEHTACGVQTKAYSKRLY